MRNLDIIYEATQLSSRYKGKLIPIMIFTGILAIVPSMLTEMYWVTFFVLLAFIAVSHGNITACLKVYHGRSDEVETYEDGLYGLKKLPQLFGTYFKYNVIKLLIIIVIAIIVAFLSISAIGDDVLYYFEVLNDATIYSGMNIVPNELYAALGLILVYVILPTLIVSFFINVIYDLYFFPTFYLLQEEDERGFGAMLKASRLMKGNKWQLFKLKLSFFGWMILAMIIAGVIGGFIGPLGTLSTLVASIIGIIVAVLIYQVRYQLALTIFYKEVIYRKESNFECLNQYKIGDDEVVNDHLVDDEDKTEFNEIFTKRDLLKGIGIFLPFYFIIGPLLMSIIIINLSLGGVEIETLALNVGLYIISLSVLVILYKRHFISIIEYIKHTTIVPFIKYVAMGVVVCYGLNIISGIILMLIQGQTVTGNQENVNMLLANFPFVTFIMTAFFGPVVEEFMFRGVFYNGLKKFGVIVAMVGTCLLFGFLHVSQYIFAGQWYRLIEIVPYAIMGSVFVVSYEKKKSLAYPICIHIAYNTLSVVLSLLVLK